MAAPRSKERKTLPVASADDLLRWYDRHGRNLPWRVKHGQQDPYRVWLSEIMLQQTTVTAVIPYYEKFLSRWPNITALAAAELDDVLVAWAGLGYYRRAHNLHRCAQTVAKNMEGIFPQNAKALKLLPGIGDYTAAAVAAIVFGERANVVDGNVERVMARLYAVKTPAPQNKRFIRELAAALLPERRVGDYAQALMDLGATVCTPKRPNCSACPWNASCLAFNQVSAESYPVASPRSDKPKRYATAFWLEDHQGQVWLRRRPPTGLLAGMLEVPTSKWQDDYTAVAENVMAGLPQRLAWQALTSTIRHSFTHFDLYVRVMYAISHNQPENGAWYAQGDLNSLALPSLMRKIAAAVALWRDG